MTRLLRVLAPLLIVALVVAGALTMFQSADTKTLTAHFPRSVSLYEGSDVRVLGVPVGQIDTVTPSGTDVVVTMHYDAEVDLPADAQAVIIAPSVVGDRYVQLTPAYDGGEKLEDGAVLDVSRTSVPLELDQIYESLDRFTVALGPTGANRNGALSDLLEVTAKNFGGQGAQFHQTIHDFSRLSQTLEANKEELFGSTAELGKFISTLAENDSTVRRFNDSLGRVSTMLAGERQELAAALRNLATALGEVGDFVRDNRASLGRNIHGLNRVAKVFVKQRDAIDEILSAAPVALNNLALTYNPQTGTLDTSSNVGELPRDISNDPVRYVCGIIYAKLQNRGKPLCDAISQSGFGNNRVPLATQARRQTGEQFDLTLGGLVEVSR